MENTENNNMDMYFSIPDYSKRFLKKKIGKSCIFFSILPYLCKPDTSDPTFKKIQLFCCLKKLELIEKEILKNNNNDEDKLRTIKYIIDSGIKYNKERYIENNLSVEEKYINNIKENNINPCGESKIKTLMIKNCLIFYHLYLMTLKCFEQVNNLGKYSLNKIYDIENIDDEKYLIKSKRLSSNSLKKIFDRDGVEELMPLLYGIFSVLELKNKNIKAYERNCTRKGNITDGKIKLNKNIKDISSLYTEPLQYKYDVIYANWKHIKDNIYIVIKKTNEAADILAEKRSYKFPKKTVYWKFDEELLKKIPFEHTFLEKDE